MMTVRQLMPPNLKLGEHADIMRPLFARHLPHVLEGRAVFPPLGCPFQLPILRDRRDQAPDFCIALKS
jgi:hypothetical protein